MGKKYYTVRFYKIHDLDLISFLETHKFNISKAIYSSLKAFAKGDMFVIEIPPLREHAMSYKRVYSRVLILDEEKDADIIELLAKIKDGKKNNFIKNLLRLYLCNPMSEDFLNDESDMDYFYKMFEIFKKNRKIAKAGSFKENEYNAKRNKIVDKQESLNSNETKENQIDKTINSKASKSDNEIIKDNFTNEMNGNTDNDLDKEISEDANNDVTSLFAELLGG